MYDRLVRLLDTHRPGDDPSALVALVPLARRRGEPEVLARLAACFVDPATSQIPDHGLTPPASVGALVGEVDERGLPWALPHFIGEAATRSTWNQAIESGRCDRDRTAAGYRLMRAFLAARPAQPPLDTVEAEAALLRMALAPWSSELPGPDPTVPGFIDRWVALGGLELAVRALATAARLEQTGPFPDGRDSYLYAVQSRAPDEPGRLDEDAVQRLCAWFRLAGQLRPSRAQVAGWLAPGALDPDERDATVELWLADDDERTGIASLCERLLTPLPDRRVRSARARARAVGALRPGQADHLAGLLAGLVQYSADAVCDYLPLVAERLGGEALDALCAFREGVSHHKYTGLAGQAIARIPGRETIRYFAPQLGSKAKTRVEDARTACLFHPIDAALELPAVIAGLAADTTRKGKAERQRAIERATAILTDDLAALHPIAMWLLLALIPDIDLRARVEAAIPAEYRRDPEVDDAAEPFEAHEWLASWPSAVGKRNPKLYDEDLVLTATTSGELSREHIRRILLGLSEASQDARHQRIETLVEHIEPDTLETFAQALLETWSRRLKQRYDDVWVVGLGARVGGPDGRLHARKALASLHAKRREERFAAALRAVSALATRAQHVEVVGLLRHETSRSTLQRRLDTELRRLLDASDEPVPLALPLPLADGALPGKKRSKGRQNAVEANRALAEQLLEWWMVQGRPLALESATRHLLDHPTLGDLRDRVVWARVASADDPDTVLALDTHGLRDATEGWVRPLHPALVTAEQLDAAVAALRRDGREPLAWQVERPVWRQGDALPLAEPTPVATWASSLLVEQGGWLLDRSDASTRLRSDAGPDAVTITLEAHDPGHSLARWSSPPTGPGASRLSDAMVDLTWLAQMPATGEALRRFRDARGLSVEALEAQLDVGGEQLADLEQRESFYPSSRLRSALWAERRRRRPS